MVDDSPTMTKPFKRALVALLLLVNGFFLVIWLAERSSTNEVGRQWIRFLFPCLMFFSSLVVVCLVWGADWVCRRRRK
jgi:hypothetical protein